MNNPQLTCFKFPKELQTLYEEFFISNDNNLRKRGIAKIRSYLTKGPIPHSIEMTGLLMETLIQDEETNDINILKSIDEEYPQFSYTSSSSSSSSNNNNNDFSIRLQYSMIIIKFVNGILDPFQQSMYNISLHKLAKDLNLPNYFVELRHASTHERLPSLEMIRLISIKILKWLKLEYWDKILLEYKENEILSIDLNDWNNKLSEIVKNDSNKDDFYINGDELITIENILKNIKKIRIEEIKSNINNRSIYTEINKLIKLIKEDKTDLIINLLIFKNFLVLHDKEEINIKQINGIKKIWDKIILKMNLNFIFKLWVKLFKLSTNNKFYKFNNYNNYNNFINNKIIEKNFKFENLQNECELKQCNEWIYWILNNINFINDNNLNSIYELLTLRSEISKEVLPIIITRYETLIEANGMKEKFEKLRNIMNNFWLIENNFEIINAEESEEYKRNKRNKVKRDEFYFFEGYENWKPVPFGCVPPSL